MHKIKRLPIYFMLTASGLSIMLNASAIDIKDGVYQIATGAELVEFASMVNSGDGNLKAALTADVDMSGLSYTPIGSSNVPYRGTFDGNCHYVRNLVINAPDNSNQGLFGYVADGAYIKNVVIDSSCSISGREFCGGIAGGSTGGGTVTFENCGNEGTIITNGANAAGIIGVSLNGLCNFNITNCYNAGSIKGGKESAALSGWVGGSSVIRNCYNAGTIVGMDGRNSLYRNNCTSTECYDIYGYQGEIIYADEISGGAAAYKMNHNGNNNIWYQTLGKDFNPVPFNTHGTVYAKGHLNCDGSPIGEISGYSNEDEAVREPHDFVDGVCAACGDVDLSFMTADADGFYAISTPQQLHWFAAYTNRVDMAACAYLTADVDFTEFSAKGAMIGEGEYSPYTGTFDGREHKVTVAYDYTKDNVALFRFIKNATIRNLLVDGTINTSARYAGGLLCMSREASLIENCVSAVDITSSYVGDATHGGLASNTFDNIVFRNCGYVGSIDAPNSEGSAGIIGYAHGNKEILLQNVYVVSNLNFATSGTYDVFARNGVQYDNCYYWTPYLKSEQATLLGSEDAVSSGELCYLIKEFSSYDCPWTQTLGTDAYPLPFKSHKNVYVAGDINCDGTLGAGAGFSNEEGAANKEEHNYVDGVCQNCGARFITTSEQLMAVAEDIASGSVSPTMEIQLGADIDMNGIYNYPGIGTYEYPFAGKFDGNGHRILNLIIENDFESYKGLFGVINGGAKIRNVIMDSSCYIYAKKWSGGIVGTIVNSGLVEISGCGNEADVTVVEANAGGILGVNELQKAIVYMTNCYNTGIISGKLESSSLSGWLGDRAKVENCYSIGAVVTGLEGDKTFARGNKCEYVNCYELNGTQVTAVTEEQVEGGELCYLLNGKQSDDVVFFQTLGEDTHPVLDKTHKVVYFDGKKYVNELLPDAIEGTTDTTGATVTGIWSLSGMKQNTLQKGINVVKMSDGTVRKVLVK